MEDAKDLAISIRLPIPSLVVLIGPSGAGKSTFARKHFRATEVLSSDYCRALVSNDENDQSATDDAFEVLHLLLAKRLARRLLTVVDATNVQAFARQSLTCAAKRHQIPAVAVVFQLTEEVCCTLDTKRTDRMVGSTVIRSQLADLAQADLPSEGFEQIFYLKSLEEIAGAVVNRDLV